MFDLENWYNNLSDDAFSKYESTKEEVKAVLVGTGEKGDTCFGKVAGFYKDLFGSTLDQVNRIFFRVKNESYKFFKKKSFQ